MEGKDKLSLEIIKDPLVVIDKDCNIVYINSAAKELLGNIEGKVKCYSLIKGNSVPCWTLSGYICPLKEYERERKEIINCVGCAKAKDRLEYFLIRQYADEEKELYAELLLPLEELKEVVQTYKEKFRNYDEVYLSKEDFESYLNSLISNGKIFYVVLINIKKLKNINEVYGITAGDLVIRSTEQVLGQLATKFNFKFTQLVGGIFVIIPKMDMKKLENFESELLSHLRKVEISYLNAKIKPRYSITTVEINPKFIKNVTDLYRLLFYAEKQTTGKSVSHFFEKEQKGFILYLQEKEKVTRKITEFLEKKAITFYLQPIVNLKSGEISHFEILMRFLENGNVVSAGVYIDFIYELDLIVDFDLLLLESLSKEKDKLIRLRKPIFINVSDEDLRFLSYRKRLRELISTFREEGIDINLELTEQVLFNNWGFVETLAADYDLKFAVDDFGTGYSSLKLVADIVQKGLGKHLKLDCSLIKNFLTNEYVRALVESVVSFAKRTGVEVIGECIETKEQLEALKSIGLDYGQGWYFYKPMPLEEALRLVKNL